MGARFTRARPGAEGQVPQEVEDVDGSPKWSWKGIPLRFVSSALLGMKNWSPWSPPATLLSCRSWQLKLWTGRGLGVSNSPTAAMPLPPPPQKRPCRSWVSWRTVSWWSWEGSLGAARIWVVAATTTTMRATSGNCVRWARRSWNWTSPHTATIRWDPCRRRKQVCWFGNRRPGRRMILRRPASGRLSLSFRAVWTPNGSSCWNCCATRRACGKPGAGWTSPWRPSDRRKVPWPFPMSQPLDGWVSSLGRVATPTWSWPSALRTIVRPKLDVQISWYFTEILGCFFD